MQVQEVVNIIGQAVLVAEQVGLAVHLLSQEQVYLQQFQAQM
jgi:hypothetical protein